MLGTKYWGSVCCLCTNVFYCTFCILFLFFCIDTAGRDAKKQIESKNKKLISHRHKKGLKLKKLYKRTPPYLTYIGDSFDQGATRLGGL